MARRWPLREGSDVSELVRLIDDYRDAHGQPPDASIARAIGVAPQTISSWRVRGIKELPSDDALRRLAQLLRVDHEDYLLQVVLYDIGRRDTLPSSPGQTA